MSIVTYIFRKTVFIVHIAVIDDEERREWIQVGTQVNTFFTDRVAMSAWPPDAFR